MPGARRAGTLRVLRWLLSLTPAMRADLAVPTRVRPAVLVTFLSRKKRVFEAPAVRLPWLAIVKDSLKVEPGATACTGSAMLLTARSGRLDAENADPTRTTPRAAIRRRLVPATTSLRIALHSVRASWVQPTALPGACNQNLDRLPLPIQTAPHAQERTLVRVRPVVPRGLRADRACSIHFAGVWNILANTRILDLLTRGGIVALTDADQGLVYGVPDSEYYVASQDPVDWDLVLLAGLLFFVMWGIRSVQFHGLARFAGVPGSLGEHTRAYIYGRGVNRFLPYGVGNVAAASALEGQGADRDRVSSALFLASVFAVFEVIVFGLYGLFSIDLMGWAGELFWPLAILLTAYLMTRPRVARPRPPGARRLSPHGGRSRCSPGGRPRSPSCSCCRSSASS